jgi:hypothetical protein
MQASDILSALETLDPEVDEHWTEDGAPRLDVVGKFIPNVTREQVTRAAPLFTRSKPELPDLTAAKEEAEAAQLTADELQRKATEAAAVAKRKAEVVVAYEERIRDAHDLTRANMKWIQSQNEQELLRFKRQRHLDQIINDAGGPAQVGPCALQKNTAARIRAARKTRVLPAPSGK